MCCQLETSSEGMVLLIIFICAIPHVDLAIILGGTKMSALTELISRIDDKALRERIIQETERATKNKKFGLVFEEHLPELTPIFDAVIRKGSKVSIKGKKLEDVWLVIMTNDHSALCFNQVAHEQKEFSFEDLVVVAEFGEPIFPSLTPVAQVTNDADNSLWHTLIEADNYHALQLLEYLSPKQVDCIYIDPPYNTGARDWKYNNNFVDSNDNWRHSKWLSMMKRRLVIAKRILKETGILVITIDDNELSHLDCLLQELFVGYERYIVTIEHNKRGRRGKNLAKTNEFALFLVKKGLEVICEELMPGLGGETRNLRRTGSGSLRGQRHKKFYPIYIDTSTESIVEIATNISRDAEIFYEIPQIIKDKYPDRELTIVWPLDKDGVEKNWHYAPIRAQLEFAAGKLSVRQQSYGWQVYYQLKEKISKKYKSVWSGSLLDASTHGTELLEKILGKSQAFDFPKSLYAVVRCLDACVRNNKNALIMDFFAGSGTTLHAVNLLNSSDDGKRRCILVTNNEVSEAEAKLMTQQGIQPGTFDWEKHGVCKSVTWPRTEYSVLGKRKDGTAIQGEYLTNQTIQKEIDRSFFQLGFIDSSTLQTTRVKKQLIALLGKDKLPQSLVKADSKFIVSEKYSASILFYDTCVDEWLEALTDQEHITDFYIVTNVTPTFNLIKEKITESLGTIIIAETIKRPMSEGFASNVEYFKLKFLDKSSVELGQQFREIVPILWLQSGAVGARPEIPVGDQIPDIFAPEGNTFAVLADECAFYQFASEIKGRKEITHVYLVTNSDASYREMAIKLDMPNVKQLYRDYIDNFVLNTRREQL